MMLLIPPAIHRVALRWAYRLRRGWWRVRRPEIRGCRVLAVDDEGRVLLVRHSYGAPHWFLPAGGLRRREDPVLAALRELGEETGCGLVDARLVEVIVEPLAGARNLVHVVAGRASGDLRIDRREVVEAGFFALDGLPQPLASALPDGLPRWLALASQHPSISLVDIDDGESGSR